MSSGLTLQEVEEKKPDGFFPKLFQNVCKNMGQVLVEKMQEHEHDSMAMIRYYFKISSLFFWRRESMAIP